MRFFFYSILHGQAFCEKFQHISVLRKSFFHFYFPLSVSLSLDRAAKLNYVLSFERLAFCFCGFFTFPRIGFLVLFVRLRLVQHVRLRGSALIGFR